MNLVSNFYSLGLPFLLLILFGGNSFASSNPNQSKFYLENRYLYRQAEEQGSRGGGKKEILIYDNQQIGYHRTFLLFLTQNYISEPHLNELLIQGMGKGIQGDYEGAIADFGEIIRINPYEVEAYYNRGIAYARLEDYPKAIADFNQAIILDQTIAEIYLERAKVYLQLGERNAAIADLNKAKQLFNQQGNTTRYQEVQRLLR